MDRRRFLQVGLGSALAALAGCDRSQQAPLEQVDFHIDWTPGVDYIGFFIAKENGLFEGASYNVRIVPGQGAEAAAQLFAQGRIGIGTTTVDAYLTAFRAGIFREGSFPRVAAVIFQKNPVVILTSAARPIVSPSDLVGRRIGFSEETSVTFRQLRLLISTQLPAARVRQTIFDARARPGPAEIHLVQVNYDGPRRLIAGELDAIVAYATDAPVELRRQGFGYQQRFISDFGLDMVGMCVCVGGSFLGGRNVSGLVEAACEGWEETRRDPGAAIRSFTALYPEIRPEDARFSLEQTLPLLPQASGSAAYMAPRMISEALQRSNALLDQMTGETVRIDPSRLTL